MEFLVLSIISSYKPVARSQTGRQNLPKNIVLADPDFDSDEKVDILLGSEFYANFLEPDHRGNLRLEISALPTFIRTVFGWVAIGKLPLAMESGKYVTCGTCTRLDDLIERFWLIEEIREASPYTQEEKDCEDHFAQHHHRDSEGRYVVKLPFKCELAKQLGQSESTAKKRFLQLERQSPDQPLEVYELQRVTFGLAPSSFLAIRVLQQLASDEGENFPLARQALLEDFYVDDYIGGASNEEEAIKLQAELTMLLKRGGFHLTKWNSNRQNVLCNVAAEERATSEFKMFEAPEEPIKTLGIAWLPGADQLYIESNVPMNNESWSRRKVYSLIARIYDPLGLVAPITAWAKINMQLLWLSTNDWDQEIPPAMQKRWNEFESQLILLKELKFSRHAVLSDPVVIQLHCFSDASEAAYGACVYLRSINSSGKVMVELCAAKSRPAPLKKISLARLELCGALLAAKLQKIVRQSLKLVDVETFMWTDATIVLHWIRAPSYYWATYVANRVSQIQEMTLGYKWMHVKGVDNPADVVSRGALPKDLLTSKLWFHGPSWLLLVEEEWLDDGTMPLPEEELLERRQSRRWEQYAQKRKTGVIGSPVTTGFYGLLHIV
uniref:Peptidase aspartic putative domain-containing protein n=1 Tax=Anopheles dirus TaxID=7168 RepID=A0A182N2S0_9DIPT